MFAAQPAAHRQGSPQQAGQLTCPQTGLDLLRRTEGRRSGLHVDIGGKGAVADRRSGPYQLGKRDRRQRFGMAEGQGPGHGHRRHRSHQAEGRDDGQLAALCKVDQALCHRDIELARRIGVDDRVADRGGQEFVLRQSAKVPDHRQAILDLRRAAGKDGGYFVGQEKLRLGHGVVAQMKRHILRLDDRAQHVQHIEVLRQPYQVLEILQRGRTPPPDKIRRMRRAGTGENGQRAQFQGKVTMRGARSHGYLLRCCGNRVRHHIAPNMHHLRIVVDDCAVGSKDLAGLRQENLHAELFQHPKRGIMDRRDPVLGKGRRGRKRIAQGAVVDRTLGCGRPGLGPTLSAAPFRGLRHHARITAP